MVLNAISWMLRYVLTLPGQPGVECLAIENILLRYILSPSFQYHGPITHVSRVDLNLLDHSSTGSPNMLVYSLLKQLSNGRLLD